MTDRKRALLDSAVDLIARKGVRGLRVEEVAHDAGVSVALIYHHFGDRSGFLNSALLHVEQMADEYTLPVEDGSGLEALTATVLAEFQDVSDVRDNSTAWGELRDAAIFDMSLRQAIADLTERWIADLAALVLRGQTDGSISAHVDPRGAAQRLTALIEGLSTRWLSDLMSTEEARAHMEAAVGNECSATNDGHVSATPG